MLDVQLFYCITRSARDLRVDAVRSEKLWNKLTTWRNNLTWQHLTKYIFLQNIFCKMLSGVMKCWAEIGRKVRWQQLYVAAVMKYTVLYNLRVYKAKICISKIQIQFAFPIHAFSVFKSATVIQQLWYPEEVLTLVKIDSNTIFNLEDFWPF